MSRANKVALSIALVCLLIAGGLLAYRAYVERSHTMTPQQQLDDAARVKALKGL